MVHLALRLAAAFISAAAVVGSVNGPCLCVFDVDRTLTGKQDDTRDCHTNEIVSGVKDTAYSLLQRGNLTLSELGHSIDQTFCRDCYLGISSAGDASGIGSGPVMSPLVLGCKDGLKQDVVRDIVNWYRGHNITIADSSVHFFDDRADNILPFKGTGFNARQISCKTRGRDPFKPFEGKALGLCGATIREVVAESGVVLCKPPGPPAPGARKAMAAGFAIGFVSDSPDGMACGMQFLNDVGDVEQAVTDLRKGVEHRNLTDVTDAIEKIAAAVEGTAAVQVTCKAVETDMRVIIAAFKKLHGPKDLVMHMLDHVLHDGDKIFGEISASERDYETGEYLTAGHQMGMAFRRILLGEVTPSLLEAASFLV